MNRKERRAAAKRKAPVSIGHTDPTVWEATNTYYSPDEPVPRDPVPGVDTPHIDPVLDQMVRVNEWHGRDQLQSVVDTILNLSHEEPFLEDGNTLKPGAIDWCWARNWNCKYVNIRIDMRDGGFIFTNDRGERISLEQLKWQYKPETKNETT